MSQQLGLIGFPLGHSISPVFQQAALDALGIDARYELWETPRERFSEISARLRAPDFLGANVTIPHKQEIRAYLDELDPTARATGAVNTVVRDGDRLIGHNTDVAGFIRAMRVDGRHELVEARVLVLGAGGAARAIVAAALLEGANSVTVAARRPEQARALVGELGARLNLNQQTSLEVTGLSADDEDLAEAAAECDVLVNATPVGMAWGHGGESHLLAPELLPPAALVCDLVYNPPLTPFLRLAADRGASILNGLPMLIYQGAAAFERWTGRPAPVDLMRRAAEEALRG